MAEKIAVPKNITTTRAQDVEPLGPPSVIVEFPQPQVVYVYNRALWFLIGWNAGWFAALLVWWASG